MHFQRRKHLAKFLACEVVRQLHEQALWFFNRRHKRLHIRSLCSIHIVPFARSCWIPNEESVPIVLLACPAPVASPLPTLRQGLCKGTRGFERRSFGF